MNFNFIYPYDKPLANFHRENLISLMEYLSLSFATFSAQQEDVKVKVYSLHSFRGEMDGVSFRPLDSYADDADSKDVLICIDDCSQLHLSAERRFLWLSSSVISLSLRQDASKIASHDVQIITFAGLGGDVEIPLPHVQLLTEDHAETVYASIATNPRHGLQRILDHWQNDYCQLFILSKTLWSKSAWDKSVCDKSAQDIIIPSHLQNVRIIQPLTVFENIRMIANSRFHIIPPLPQAIFSLWSVLGQAYGVPSLSYNYPYSDILNPHKMGGVNVSDDKQLDYYLQMFCHKDDFLKELSIQARNIRYDASLDNMCNSLLYAILP